MDQFVDFLLYGQLVALLALSLLLYFLGFLVSQGDETITQYRQRARYGTFLAFGAFIFWHYRPADSELIIALLLRTLMVVGMGSGIERAFEQAD